MKFVCHFWPSDFLWGLGVELCYDRDVKFIGVRILLICFWGHIGFRDDRL